MDESAKIERMIQVMQELQVLVNQLEQPDIDVDIVIGTIVALIITTQVPDVTILPNIREEVAFA